MPLLKNRALAPEGRRRIDFAAKRMPVLSALGREFAVSRPLAGVRIAACLHVTTETANLCRVLVAGGAELALCASNPLSTKDDVAAAIHEDLGAEVFAVHGCDRDVFYSQVESVLASEPRLIVDDGADLTSTIHREHPELLEAIVGGTEVTSTGVLRLRNMAREGTLRFPVIAVNDAATKHLFDNRYGTGQNTIDGIVRATNVLLAGSVLVVVGYGWVGRGIALRARGMGARVVVCEVDPVKALEAAMEGYEVLPVSEAVRIGDIIVTATGNCDAIGVDDLLAVKSGAIVCNSGHFDVEVDVAGLRAQAISAEKPRPNVVEYTLADGRQVVVLAEGRLVGQSCAEAHPATVMDMTFSVQALAVRYLIEKHRTLAPVVHEVPGEIDGRVAREKLEALGIRHDELSQRQREYLASWQLGT